MSASPAPVDSTVRIPAAARAAAARAEEIHRQAYAPPEVPVDSAAPNPDGAKEQEPQKAATPPAPPVEPAAPVPPVAPKAPDEDSWEHKYNSMKGRFARAERTANDNARTIADLTRQIAELRQATDKQPEPVRERLISSKEEEDFGQELLDVVGRRAREELNPEVSDLKRQVADLKDQLGKTSTHVARSAQERLFDTLDQQCPTWKDLNNDDEFISWLQLPDLYSGAIRHELLKGAYEQNDAPRVLAFFQGFLSERAATVPAATRPDLTPTPPVVPKIPLETLAAPGRAKTAATTVPAEKPIITRAQIAQFYTDVAAGRYRGRDEEKNAAENMIFAAERDGRIR